MTTDDAFPKIITGTPKMTQDVTVLYEARKHLEEIREAAHRSNYDFPEGTYLAKIHAEAVDAIAIIDSLRWLWDEVVPSPEYLAELKRRESSDA